MAVKRATTRRVKSTNAKGASEVFADKRKAPLRKVDLRSRDGLSKPVMALMALLLLSGGVGVVVGVADDGVINVATVVSERNDRAAESTASGKDVSSVSIPVNNVTSRTPNGGLNPSSGNTSQSALPPAEVLGETTVTEDQDSVSEENSETTETTTADSEENEEDVEVDESAGNHERDTVAESPSA